MTKSYEQPTDDLRQVKRPIKSDNGVCGPVHHNETIGYDTTIQRKWLVFDGLTSDTVPCYGSRDGTMVNGVKGREEWRDLDTVWTEKPQMRAL